MERAVLRTGLIAAVFSLVVVLAAGYFAELQNRALFREQARADVAEALSHVRADIESNLNSNIQLVRGLVGMIAAEPTIDQDKFAQLASHLLGEHSQLRNVAGAPDLVVELMHPLAGNEAVIGLDYLEHPVQRDAVIAAMELGTVVLAGPVDLVQGGRGFIVRHPVFIANESGTETPWGLVAAVIDVDRLYTDSGLLEAYTALEVAIMGRDADLSDTSVFFGNAETLRQDPVTARVALPNGGWKIAAIPRGGWTESPPNTWTFRALVALAGLALVLPISIAGFFYDQLRIRTCRLSDRESEMRNLSQRLDLALETSSIGVWELNLDTQQLNWDRRMKELYGIPSHVTPNAVDHWKDKLHPEDRTQAILEFEQALATGNTYRSVFRVVPETGVVRWIKTIGACHRTPRGDQILVGVNWDATDEHLLKIELMEANRSAESRNEQLEEARRQMEHNSLHDILTGLPNRRYLEERIFGDEAEVTPTAIIHIDLDRFKQINDTLGHAAGDAMLVHAAEVLRNNTRSSTKKRPGDIVARLGGDEFVIVATGPVGIDRLKAMADRIIKNMQKPILYKNHTCRIGASIGIALSNNDDADTNNQILIDADLALYQAKNQGRNCCVFFDASLKAKVFAQKKLADEILAGVENKEFVPFFQPQFDATTLDIVGVEALARWDHPTKGILTPDEFLDTAEDLNIVSRIDHMILEKTLFASAQWKAVGIDIPKKSVNVSAGRLSDPELIGYLEGLSFKPHELSFELLESIFLDEKSEAVARNLERLSEIGIQIELDDYGAGYTSIIGLLELKPSQLKIERRLVKPIVSSTRSRQLVASVIETGRSLGIGAVAEGVETFDHVAILRDLGCDTLQGYALAKPMTSAELIDFVASETWRDKAA